MWPFNEDLMRFDFEVNPEDEDEHGITASLLGTITPPYEQNSIAIQDYSADTDV
jgi:hypothetical protein